VRSIAVTRKKSRQEQALLELRRDFEAGFARAPQTEAAAATRDLLAVRVAGQGHALALDEIARICVDPALITLPGAPPALLGLASIRAVLVPVYDLAVLLGLGGSEKPRWLALCAGSPILGLAFEALDTHLRIPLASIAAEPSPSDAALARGVVRLGEQALPLLHVQSLRDRVARSARGEPT
jgi:chemotaxis signal transduction protein